MILRGARDKRVGTLDVTTIGSEKEGEEGEDVTRLGIWNEASLGPLSRRDTIEAREVTTATRTASVVVSRCAIRVPDTELSTPVIAGCLVGLQLEFSYEVT